MEWIAYCTVCGEVSRGPNGDWEEAEARVHRRKTGHMTIVGYEPSIVMSGEMVEIKIEEQEEVYYWEIVDISTGEILQHHNMFGSVQQAVDAAKSHHIHEMIYSHGKAINIKIYDKPPIERGEPPYGDVLPVYSESWTYLGAAPPRPFPQTFGDWVDIAEDIKEKDPRLASEVNENLGYIFTEDPAQSEEAKRWLVGKAGELGIT